MADDEISKKFEELTRGLDMSEVEPITEGESYDEQVAETVQTMVSALTVDFEYVTAVATELEDRGWSPEGAERIAEMYLRRALYRSDMLQAREGEE